MTIDDLMARLCSLPRMYKPKFGHLPRRMLRVWLLMRRSPEFRREFFDLHRLEDRTRPIRPDERPEDMLLVHEAFEVIEYLWAQHQEKNKLKSAGTRIDTKHRKQHNQKPKDANNYDDKGPKITP